MRTGVSILCFAMLLLPASVAAQAPHLSLDIRNGQVTLDARNVTLHQVLEEWARVGGIRVINNDKVVAPPITLLLRDLPERQALDVLLRSQGGYILVAKPAGMSTASAFGGIMIVPSSAASDAPGARASNAAFQPAMEPGPGAADASFAEAAAGTDSNPSAELRRIATEIQTAVREVAGGGAGSPAAANSATPPPTPILAPSAPRPIPGNPFGTFTGTGRPGDVTPTGPPAGFVYPPVTNPNAGEASGPATPAR